METPQIFISHRHEDAKIADVVTRHLKDWNINEGDIFQSSDPRHGVTSGEKVNDALNSILENINLLILIYTFKEGNWSYPMWECGIAQGKSTVPTRIVVLKCTEDDSDVLSDEKYVPVSPDGIHSFVRDFHKKAGFIPIEKHGGFESTEAFADDTADETIVRRSERLYEDLKEVIPSGTSSSQHLWDFIRLRVDSEPVSKIKSLTNKGQILSILRESIEVREPKFVGIGNSVDTAVKQFGYDRYAPNLKLKDLLDRWKEMDTTKNTAWIDDIYDAIYRSITNKPSATVSNTLKSVLKGTEWWFFPVTTRMRLYRDHSVEFDLYLISTKPVVTTQDSGSAKVRSQNQTVENAIP